MKKTRLKVVIVIEVVVVVVVKVTLLSWSDRGLSKEEDFGLGGINMDGPIT